MNTWLAAQAYARPDGVALYADGESLTYHELYMHTLMLAEQFAAWGVQAGMQIALLLPNSQAAVVCVHASIQCGATLVLLNTRLTASEIDSQLAQTTCQHLVYSKETAATAKHLTHPLQIQQLDQVLGSSQDLPQSRITSNTEHVPPVAPDHGNPSMLGRDTPYQSGTPLQCFNVHMLTCSHAHMLTCSHAPLAIIFTSGTSGTPKGAMLSQEAFFASAMASAYRIGTLPDDRWLCVLPIFHVGGLSILLRACLYGSAVDLWRQFDAARIAESLATHPITLISLVPTMLQRLLDVPNIQVPPRLRLVLLGGAAATPALIERAMSQGWPISTTYGLTEAASQVATALPEAVRRKPSSVGKPLIFTQVRIVDEHGNDQPPSVYGEIMVSGPTLMDGYLGAENAKVESAEHKASRAESIRAQDPSLPDPDPNASAPTQSYEPPATERIANETAPCTGTACRAPTGIPHPLPNASAPMQPANHNASRANSIPPTAFATGDIGYLDADGDLFIVQRRSDLIVSGGENIYPAEVEAVLRSHPAIVDATVVGIDSAEWGQRVAAMLVVREEAPSQAEIEAYCRERLAGYKIPRLVVFTHTLPRNAAGKIQRQAVVDQILAAYAQ